MALQKLCRYCCCGTNEESSEDDSQPQSSGHDPNSCPNLASSQPPPVVNAHTNPPRSETDDISLRSLHGSSAGPLASRSVRISEINDAPQPQGGRGTSMGSNQVRDPPLSVEEARIRGRQMIQWIENPSASDPPCPVSMNTLTYQELNDQCDGDMSRLPNFTPDVQGDAPLRYPEGVEPPRDYIQRHVGFDDDSNYYTLFFAQGVIGLYDINRELNSSNPHPTDVALTLYREEFGALDTLRRVFVYGVINTQTVNFIYRHFEASPDELEHCVYVYGTPEYESLLGARIPRTVGYLVLGAFPRGERRITRIEVYVSTGDSYDMRFDIEAIQ